MSVKFDQTVWRGICVRHPAEWELVFASSHGHPGRCSFADRRYERLRVEWHRAKPETNFRKMLEDVASKKREEGKQAEALRGQAEGWYGTVEQTETGTLVHAGRFLEKAGLLADVLMIWPGKRDRRLENEVLSGIAVTPEEDLWQAMGLKVRVPQGYDLLHFLPEAGKVWWEFGRKDGKPWPRFSVERLAVPRYWLKVPLEKWLEGSLEKGARAVSVGKAAYKGHEAVRLLSTKSGGAWDKVRGRREHVVHFAWKCPVEERVYHMRFSDMSRGAFPALPSALAIECCREPPLTRQAEAE